MAALLPRDKLLHDLNACLTKCHACSLASPLCKIGHIGHNKAKINLLNRSGVYTDKNVADTDRLVLLARIEIYQLLYALYHVWNFRRDLLTVVRKGSHAQI